MHWQIQTFSRHLLLPWCNSPFIMLQLYVLSNRHIESAHSFREHAFSNKKCCRFSHFSKKTHSGYSEVPHEASFLISPRKHIVGTQKCLTEASFLISPRKHIVCTQKCLTEALLKSTNMYSWRNKKNDFLDTPYLVLWHIFKYITRTGNKLFWVSFYVLC